MTRKIAVFDNPSFVDTSNSSSAESDTIQASLTSLGNSVSTFTTTLASGIQLAIADKNVLLIPEQEYGSLIGSLDTQSREVIKDFVNKGGMLIVNGSGGSKTSGLLNGIFGFSTTEQYSGSTFSKTTASLGTEFADDPGSISANSATSVLSNLPAGSSNIYTDGSGGAAVASIQSGSGKVVFLGWDWFNAAPLGTTNNGWLSVLNSAVLESSAVVNTAPTDLGLSNTSINENVAANSTVGTFTSTDPNTGNTFTYNLVAGTGDTNNSAFSIVGNQLQINASPDFETKSTYNIRVRTTDQGGLTYDKPLVVNINDIDEFIYGTPNNDILNGTASADQINGLAGSDIIYGKAGNDIINGGDGDDVVYGGNDNDLLRGGNGSDRLYGDAGKDELLGEDGNDILYGGDGDDLLNGGAGSDQLYGNAGIDTFVLGSGMGLDSIYNFQDGIDIIRLDGGLTFGALQIAQSGTSTLIKIASTGETLASLINTNSALIGASDFSGSAVAT